MPSVKLPDGAVTRATFCIARHIAEANRRTRGDGHAWDRVGAVERRGPVPRHRRAHDARRPAAILGVPRWVWRVDVRPSFPVEEHREPLDELCARRLNESSSAALRFDVLGDENGSTVVLRWRHLMLDAKGAEIFLAEIARSAENGDSPPPRAGS